MIFLSCSFTIKFVQRKHDKFVKVAEYMLRNNLNQLTKEKVSDEVIKSLFKELTIDVVTNGNQGHQYGHEPKDSVIVFVNHGSYFFGKYKRVFYDYTKTDRHYRDTSIVHNSYVFKRAAERLYVSSQKKDR